MMSLMHQNHMLKFYCQNILALHVNIEIQYYHHFIKLKKPCHMVLILILLNHQIMVFIMLLIMMIK